MRYAIVILMAMATVAQAGWEWLYKPVDTNLGTYTEQRVKGFGYGTPANALYQGRDQKRVDVPEVITQTNLEGVVETVTNQVALPIDLCYWTFGMDAPRAATATEISNRAATAQAAAYNKLVANAQAFLAVPDNMSEAVSFATRISTFTNITATLAANGSIPFPTARAMMEQAIMDKAMDTSLSLETRLEESRQIANDSRICEGIYNLTLAPAGMTGVQLGVLMQVLQGGQ